MFKESESLAINIKYCDAQMFTNKYTLSLTNNSFFYVLAAIDGLATLLESWIKRYLIMYFYRDGTKENGTIKHLFRLKKYVLVVSHIYYN